MDSDQASELYQEYCAAVAYVAVRTSEGEESIGTAFHIGANIWITARHVVEGNTILKVATTERSLASYSRTLAAGNGLVKGELFSWPGTYNLLGEPMLHPKPDVDVAALRLDGPFNDFLGEPRRIERASPTPVIQLGGWLDDWIGNELMLSPVLVMGYPPIPFGREPLLVATRAEISAILDKRGERHPYFVISAMARAGFSGSLALTAGGEALGVASQSLVMNHMPAELGYFAILAVEPIYNCLDHHDIVPAEQAFAHAMLEDEGKQRPPG